MNTRGNKNSNKMTFGKYITQLVRENTGILESNQLAMSFSWAVVIR